MDTFLRRYDDTPETQTLRRPCEGRASLLRRQEPISATESGFHATITEHSLRSYGYLPSKVWHQLIIRRPYEGMTTNTAILITRHSCEAGLRPCEGRGSIAATEFGLKRCPTKHSLRSYGYLPTKVWRNKIMKLSFQSPLRRQGSISATEFGLKRCPTKHSLRSHGYLPSKVWRNALNKNASSFPRRYDEMH